MSAHPENALPILSLVAAGKSPWSGWDLACTHATAKQRARAYGRRRDQIQACRAAGLLGDDGVITEAGDTLLRARARAEAGVG